MLNSDQIEKLQLIAEQHDGKCDRCHRKIAIYRYKVNKQMATVLEKMASESKKTGLNMVNFDALNIPYRLGSQRTKMRLHGLIAKFRGGDGVHVQNTWLITKKGGDFLRGIPVQETVVVFDNQVIGHEGKMVSIESLIDEVVTIADPITTPEADVYHDVRTPKRDATHQAEYVGPDRVGIKRGERYEITVSRMVMGQPVKVTDPFEFNYRDIAAFQREWKIV